MDFQTVKSLTWTFAPFLLSYGYSYYRNLQAQSAANAPARRPLPPHVRGALNLLLVGATIHLILSFPYFSPENVITFSSSRLQTQSLVLWRRIAALRPNGELTSYDALLQDRLTSIESRCLYLVYGPEIMINCQFCKSDDPRSYFLYALPAILLPHLGNIASLGLATSSILAGKEGSRWRMHATLAAFMFAVFDVYCFYAYDHTRNARVTRPEQLVHFWWNMRTLRHLGGFALQAGFTALLWASSTNRLFVTPYTAVERINHIIQQFQAASGKTSGASIVQNAVARDAVLRQKYADYWERDGNVVREVMADEQVQQAILTARSSGRLNLDTIERDARIYAENLIASSQNSQPSRSNP